MSQEPERIYLRDYRAPDYLAPEIDLDFDIRSDCTIVTNRTRYRRSDGASPDAPLILDGERLTLKQITLNQQALPPESYEITDGRLTLHTLPAAFVLEVVTEIRPDENRSGLGLYRSGGSLCTQMEAEGFRTITYFQDRPDVMSRYTTKLSADRDLYPVLLSNGNPIEQGSLRDNRHFATWEDPFAKPSYLFALVAGKFDRLEDYFTTKSGRRVSLQIYAEQGNGPRCQHALDSLKKAMQWDEEVYGLEYDLDNFMVVAVDDFNAGAMENKGLNIFNSRYVLADPLTATDQDYLAVESVIAHEYFHNWTGNRVTCRDWFQLTLKEGLTVFRDQEFSSDMNSRSVKRIADVRTLRTYQFPEDDGPNAHPIKPTSYIEIDNFYTTTVYRKGSEVIRMIHTLIGREKFLQGIAKYFEMYDGQAVTTEDFLHAMAIVSGFDFTLFRRWYEQAGTPICGVKSSYDPAARRLTVEVRQIVPERGTPPMPLHFPLIIGALDRSGRELPLVMSGDAQPPSTGSRTLEIREPHQTFSFENLPSPPILSLLRGFSAPVKLEYEYSEEDLRILLEHDTDDFNRYEAGQRLAIDTLEKLMSADRSGTTFYVPDSLEDAFVDLLRNRDLDYAFRAEALTLPNVETIVDLLQPLDYEVAINARQALIRALVFRHYPSYERTYHDLAILLEEGGQSEGVARGMRKLKNLCLEYMVQGGHDFCFTYARDQFDRATNMTDQYAAFALLCDFQRPETTAAIRSFREQWLDFPLVMDKWFMAQASSRRADALEVVLELEQDPLFDRTNPNKLRSLYAAFGQNYLHFHRSDGRGYNLMAERILEIDRFNYNVACRLATVFNKYQKLDKAQATRMCEALMGIISTRGISKGLFEMVSKTLESRFAQP